MNPAIGRKLALGSLFLGIAIGCHSDPVEGDIGTPAQRQPLTTPGKGGPGSGTGQGGGVGGRKGPVLNAVSSKFSFKLLSAGSLGDDRIVGYRHTHARSKTPVGAAEAALPGEAAIGIKRYLNSQGTFVEWPNGFSAASPHANSALRHSKPYSIDRYAHEDRVLRYFKDAGIPQAQIGQVDVSATLLVTGSDVGGEQTRRLIGFTTILRRVVDGVEVADSYAWARFNDADEVVSERVWWPDLPGGIRTEIAAFRAALADLSQYRAKLPSEVASRAGKLSVHHAPPVGESWYHAVTWEVDSPESKSSRNFDLEGKELRLVAWASPAGDPR